MEIVWTPTGDGAVTLCHGTERGVGKATGPGSWEPSEQTNVQVDNRIRSATGTLFDRGNLLHSLEFSVVEEYASITAATVDFHRKRDLLGREGALLVKVDASNHLTYNSGVLDIVSRRQSGVAIAWRYRVTAPTITLSDPS